MTPTLDLPVMSFDKDPALNPISIAGEDDLRRMSIPLETKLPLIIFFSNLGSAFETPVIAV